MNAWSHRSVPFLAVLAFVGACKEPERVTDRPTAERSSGASFSPRAEFAPAVASANAAPSVPSLPLITGTELLDRVRRTTARGVVINAWASWCGPCKQELPMLAAQRAALPQIEFLFVSVDEPDAWENAAAVMKEHGIEGGTYAVSGRLGPFKRALHPGWQGMIPATFLFDAAGKLRYFWGGPVFEKELVPVLEGYLRGDAIDGEQLFGLAPGKVLE